MSIDHRFETLDKHEWKGYFDHYPDKCPICKRGIHPVFLGIYSTKPSDENHQAVDIVFRCPLSNCLSIFVGQYRQTTGSISSFNLIGSRRIAFLKGPIFPDEIAKVSPAFINIYAQAEVAEKNDLDEICGCGYRRAFEFLLKDYLNSLNPKNIEHLEKVRKMPVGSCISEIKDKRIQGIAKRAAWLGNDETHYSRKWEEHDLQDLKNLIKITVSWINTDLLSRKYEEEMPDPKEKDT